MAWRKKVREASSSVLAQHGNKLVTTVVSMVMTALALWVYTNFVNKPVSVLQDAIHAPEVAARVESNFGAHLVKEKDYREKQTARVDDLDRRLRDLELTVSFLRGRTQK